jgi:hypothetical protein
MFGFWHYQFPALKFPFSDFHFFARQKRAGFSHCRTFARSWKRALTPSCCGLTGAASVELHIPKQRKGSYFPGFLEPHRLAAGCVREPLACDIIISLTSDGAIISSDIERAMSRTG